MSPGVGIRRLAQAALAVGSLLAAVPKTAFKIRGRGQRLDGRVVFGGSARLRQDDYPVSQYPAVPRRSFERFDTGFATSQEPGTGP